MEDHRSRRVADLLRELPREHSRPGFTARVLVQLDAKPPNASPWSFRIAPAKPAIMVAALLAVAISAGSLIELQGRARKYQEVVRARQTLQELRAEHGRLEQELRAIADPPVVYLGSDETVDYVLDLGKIPDAKVVTSATPAAYQISTF